MSLVLYTLDPLWRRQYVVDEFISLIWTERWQAYGDFQIQLVSTLRNRLFFTNGTYLALNKSNYVMRVESVEDDANDDGTRILIIKGRSMEAVMDRRAVKDSTDDLTTSPTWTITDKPASMARTIFDDICVTGVLDTNDILYGITTDTWPYASSIAEPDANITIAFTPTTLFDAVVNQICVPYGLGFRILRNDGNSALYFNIYTGDDRTSSQTVFPAVVFSPELDNLQNTKELTTIDQSANVAYVFSPAGFEKVYPDGVDPDTLFGLVRRVIVVDGSSVTSDNPDISGALIQLGTEALMAAQSLKTFDGEISQNSAYIYGKDYFLGDLVTSINIDGIGNEMRVAEQIFAEDNTGESSYPTLTLAEFIDAGSWLAYPSATVWEDLDSDETTWSELP